MSDPYGPKQTRVLDSENRNFEEIIYQLKKPPLSCEVNLTGKLSADKSQNLARYIGPSGWSIVGQIKDDVQESACCAGDIVCSSSYAANTLKLIALDRGVETKALKAIVNGWEIIVQGTDSSDENNIIELDTPPFGSRVNFVFLEVWRKLITTSDTIYKHGNFLYGGQNYQNDLIDPAINIETSLRVQIQYRIRVAECNLEDYPDGFDPSKVFVQGPLSSISTCSHAYFSPVEGDIGLWRAGLGDSAAQDTLQTVDGYTYAIPICAIHRRNTGNYNPETRANGSGRSLTDYLNGYASDRPDNLYNNWVVSTDILDMRHRIHPSENLKEIANDGFKKIISGKSRGVMVRETSGEDHYGTVLVQSDSISNTDPTGSTRIGQGDSIRRMFANAEMEQSETISIKTVANKTTGISSTPWAADDAVQLTIPASYPIGTTIKSIEEIYTINGPLDLIDDYTLSTLSPGTVEIAIPASSSIILGSEDLSIEYTIDFAVGTDGFTYTPDEMLEYRNLDSTMSYALPENDIRVRTSDPVITTDGTKFNMLSNRGASRVELYDFGHQMTYHYVGRGIDTINDLPRVIEGFPILGIISVSIDGVYKSITVSRDPSSYTVSFGEVISSGKDVEFVLYTGGKFFETSKQGRGIIETYEMNELIPNESAGGGLTDFTVDSTSKIILGMASTVGSNGAGFAYVNGVQTALSTNNSELPYDSTKTRVTLTFPSAPTAGQIIEFPLLMKSYITSSEKYAFFYNRTPYQGLLDSTVIGSIEAEGPSIITTAGSGSVTDYTYSVGTAIFSEDSTTVNGLNTEWLSNVKSGYVISSDSTPQNEYVISEVYTDSVLFLQSPSDMSSSSLGDSYTIRAKDIPYFTNRNIIDRLPTYDSNNDSSGKNEAISTSVSEPNPILNTRIISDIQGITELPPNIVTIGENTADRGRSKISIPEEYAPLGVSTLGLNFEKLDSTGEYQKAYQSYILNKENSGKLYLMIVGSETDNTTSHMHLNERSVKDSVDIFELPGRPLTNRRQK